MLQEGLEHDPAYRVSGGQSESALIRPCPFLVPTFASGRVEDVPKVPKRSFKFATARHVERSWVALQAIRNVAFAHEAKRNVRLEKVKRQRPFDHAFNGEQQAARRHLGFAGNKLVCKCAPSCVLVTQPPFSVTRWRQV